MEAYPSDPSARSKAKVNTDNDGSRSKRGLEEHFSDFIDGCFSYIGDRFELDHSFSAEFMPNKIGSNKSSTPLPSRVGIERVLRPGTPILVSPASPISSPSSPNRGSREWDSPQTPLLESDQVDLDLSTPLTPLEPIDAACRTPETCSFIDWGTRATPSDETHESYPTFADSDTKVCRNLHSDFQAIRKSGVNQCAAIADKNAVITPTKLESTSADADNNFGNPNMEIQIKIEVSQATLGDDLTPRSLKRSDLSKQSATGADLSRTEFDDPVPSLATVTKKVESDSFQGLQKNQTTPHPVWEPETRKLFSGFTMDPEDNTATSLRLDKQNISFKFCTSAQVHFGSAVRDNHKVVTAKSRVRTGSVGLDPRAVVASQSISFIKGLDKVLKHIIPFEVRERLSDDEHRCVASYTKTPSRCVSKNYGPSSVLSARLASIVTSITGHDYVALPDLVEDFLAVAVCNRHRMMALSQSNKTPRMNVLRELVGSFPNVPKRNTKTFRRWLQAIVGHELPSLVASTICQPYQPTSSTGLSARLDHIMPAQAQARVSERSGQRIVSGHEPSRAKDATLITTPSYSPKFNPYQAKWSSNASIAQSLRTKIITPLSEADQKDGYVYIFWDQQHFGMVKIGRTDDLGKRLKQWNRQCKTTFHYHQSSQDGKLFKVPHIQRVERLIQIELINCRRRRTCKGCNQTHIEWFDIDEAKAVQVYQKWRDWILKEPYAEDHTGKWTIRPDMLQTLSKVCEPVSLEETKEKRPQLRRRSANDVLKQRKTRKPT